MMNKCDFGIFVLTLSLGSIQLLHGTIIERSPFIPPDFHNLKADSRYDEAISKTSDVFSLNGVYLLNGMPHAIIASQQSGAVFWTRKGEAKNGIELMEYNGTTDSCKIRLDDGSFQILEMRKSIENFTRPSLEQQKQSFPVNTTFRPKGTISANDDSQRNEVENSTVFPPSAVSGKNEVYSSKYRTKISANQARQNQPSSDNDLVQDAFTTAQETEVYNDFIRRRYRPRPEP